MKPSILNCNNNDNKTSYFKLNPIAQGIGARAGVTLIEVAIALTLTSVALAGGAHAYSQYLRAQTNQATANHLKTVANAYDRYLQDNSGDVIKVAKGNGGIYNSLSIGDLVNQGYLNRSFLGKGALNPFGQSYAFYSRFHEESGGRGRLESFVYTVPQADSNITTSDALRISQMLGAGGAFITDDGVQSSFGGVELDPVSIGASTGSLVSAMYFDEANAIVSDFLYRNDVGDPSLNTMNTNLRMGNNSIDGARDVDASGSIKVGGKVTASGDISSSGRIVASGDITSGRNISASSIEASNKIEAGHFLPKVVKSKDSTCSSSELGFAARTSNGEWLSCQQTTNGLKWSSYMGRSGDCRRTMYDLRKHVRENLTVNLPPALDDITFSYVSGAQCRITNTYNFLCTNGSWTYTGMMSRYPDEAYCGSTCFPAGSLVLMADGSWKEITQIKPGDWVQGPTCAWEVDYLYSNILGHRRMLSFSDRSLTWSDEHLFWAKKDGKQWWWCANPDQWREEVYCGDVKGLKDNFSLMTGSGFEFAHVESTWASKTVIDVTRIDDTDYHTKVYLPVPKGKSDLMCFVNGFVVTCFTDQWAFDYDHFDWNEAKAKAILKNMKFLPEVNTIARGVSLDTDYIKDIRLKAQKIHTNINNDALVAA